MIDTLFSGLIHGSAYALVAVGMSLIFGVTNVANFAQGSIVAVGMMVAWWLGGPLGLPIIVVIPVVALVCGIIGLLMNIGVIAPLEGRKPIAALLATIGIGQILFFKFRRRYISACKGIRAWIGHGKIHLCRLGGAKVLVGAALLHLVEGIPEHLVVGFLPVEQKIDGFPHFFIPDLPVQVFIHDLCPLFRRNVAEQVCTKVSGNRDIVRRPGVAGGIDQAGIQAQQDMGLDLTRLDLIRLHLMSVEQIDRLGDHLHVPQLLGGNV